MTFTAPERKEGEPPRLIVVSNRLPVTIKKDAKTGEYTYKVGLSSLSSLCLCEVPSESRSLILLSLSWFRTDVVIYSILVPPFITWIHVLDLNTSTLLNCRPKLGNPARRCPPEVSSRRSRDVRRRCNSPGSVGPAKTSVFTSPLLVITSTSDP